MVTGRDIARVIPDAVDRFQEELSGSTWGRGRPEAELKVGIVDRPYAVSGGDCWALSLGL